MPTIVKRITEIGLKNCRAYHGEISPFLMSKGENIIIYGENGSGKSSLYKSLRSYFASSIDNTIAFPLNKYALGDEGYVTLQFAEFDANWIAQTGSQEKYQFGTNRTDTSVEWLELTSLVGGFLDYTDLLKVYLHQETKPNLFELIALTLLGQRIPFASGGTFRFAPKWKQLQEDLTSAYTRKTTEHQAALADLPRFEGHLRGTLDVVFTKLNQLLSSYFPELEVQLQYDLHPLIFNYGRKWEWYTTAELYLEVFHKGNRIDEYGDFLNEARLSAIAICLYLSSILQNPATGNELKIIYLDDVFIGLDAANRRPILEILKNEFSDYQIFISTYDRHWYELAKKQFEVSNSRWISIEMYVGQKDVNGSVINQPLIVNGDTNFEKALQFLHNRIKPDYPASANYFRKSIEELLIDNIPAYELADSEYTQIPGFRLTAIIRKALAFFEKTNSDSSNLQTINQFLHVLIHPLSHYEISSPIYKGELKIIENSILKLREQFLTLNLFTKYQCVLESGARIKITVHLDTATTYIVTFELYLNEAMIISQNNTGDLLLEKCKCYVDKATGIKDGKPLKAFNPNKYDPRFSYASIEDAYNKIYDFHQTQGGVTIAKVADYISAIEYHDTNVWQPISSKLVWK